MKNFSSYRIHVLVILVLTFFFSINLFSQKRSKADRKDYKEWLRLSKTHAPDDFVLFIGGVFSATTSSQYYRIPQQDSATIKYVYSEASREVLDPYALSKKEVTNREYRTFVNWVVDSIALSIMAKSDPSFYLDPQHKGLNWGKRSVITDSNSFQQLSPLYVFVPDKSHPRGGKYQLDVNQVMYCFNTVGDKQRRNLSVYPDTLVWLRGDIFSYDNTVMAKRYYTHPGYENYPVVGVSWEQATAYCDWLSRFGSFRFRLPSSAEFHNAYYYPYTLPKRISTNRGNRGKGLISYNSGLPWNDWTLWDNRGNYLANFGSITDKYDFSIKGFGSDGYFYTSKVGAYPPSISGVYELSGNVAEWVSDTLQSQYVLAPLKSSFVRSPQAKNISEKNSFADTVGNDPIILYHSDSIKVLIEKLYDYSERAPAGRSRSRSYWIEMGSPVDLPLDGYLMPVQLMGDSGEVAMRTAITIQEKPWYYDEIESIISIAKDYKRNLQIIASKALPRLVMGGSWQDGPLFLQAGVKQVFDATITSSKIGFRIAADVISTPALEEFKLPTRRVAGPIQPK